jgi:hypothetical protein
MDRSTISRPSILATAHRYWSDLAIGNGPLAAPRFLLASIWEFLRDSTPARLRQRYGDADYDWDYRVNTTSGAVGWRDRLLGVFHSAYQPTEPAAFHEMLNTLHRHANLEFAEFIFIDLGSGKGRTLLMASDYPFRRILGVELLPALHQIAEQNVALYKSDAQKCFALESVCADATRFRFPEGPLVIYLFNPLPEAGLRNSMANLEESLSKNPRPVYVLYHNPLLEHVLTDNARFKKIVGAHQYSIFAAAA